MDAVIINNGYCSASVRGDLPESTKHNTLLVVGAAEMEHTVVQAKDFVEKNDCDLAACNATIAAIPGNITYAVSLHSSKLPAWVKGRKRSIGTIVCSKPVEGVDVSIACDRPVGTSAMLAVILGKAAGYERIVLVGVDLGEPAYCQAQPYWKAAKASGLLDGVETLTGGWLAMLLAGKV